MYSHRSPHRHTHHDATEIPTQPIDPTDDQISPQVSDQSAIERAVHDITTSGGYMYVGGRQRERGREREREGKGDGDDQISPQVSDQSVVERSVHDITTSGGYIAGREREREWDQSVSH